MDEKNNDQNTGKEKTVAEIKLELLEYSLSLIDRTDAKIWSKLQWHAALLILILAIFGYQALNLYNSALSKVDKLTDDQVKAMQKNVKARLDDEFKTPRIQAMIESSAKEYTGEAVTRIVEKKISPYSQEMIAFLSKSKKENKELTDFYNMVLKADAGSFTAYNDLQNIARSKSVYSEIATSNITAINSMLNKYTSPTGAIFGLSINKGGKNIPIDELSTKELFKKINDLRTNPDHRHTIMASIVKKPKREVLGLSVETLRNSDSLYGIAATCGILSSVLGDKAKFMNIDAWIKVCEEELKKPVESK